MIIVVVGDDNGVDSGDLADIARGLGVSLGPQPRQRRATVFEHWVKEHPQAGWKLDIIAGMS